MKKHLIKQIASRVPKKRRKGWWKKWLILIPIVTLIFAFVYFANLPKYQIININVQGLLLTKTSEVKESVQRNLSGRYLFLIPKTFFWFYPRGDIKASVLSNPSILDVELDLDQKSSTLNIIAFERKQEYVWCDGPEVSERKCFYMDKSGLLFIEAPEFEGNIFLTFSGLVDKSDPINKRFLPNDDMEDMLSFLSGLKDLGLVPVSVNASSTREVYVKLKSGTDLIITIDEALDSVLSNIGILLRSDEFNQASGGITSLNYIDLRYGSKAFWK